MSAKKSWDVVRREPVKAAAPQGPRPSTRRVPARTQSIEMRRVEKRAAPVPVAAHSRLSIRDVENPRGGKPRSTGTRQPLKAKRKKQEKRFWILLGIVIVFLIAAAFCILWLPILRIQSVQADGGSAEDLHNIATRDMQGSYYFIIPKNSIFFIPEKTIRKDILSAHPEIEALSISAKELNTLTLHTVERSSAFWWCGTSVTDQQASCYDANAAGLIFGPASAYSTSSTAMLRLYASIDATTTDPSFPVNAHINGAASIPNALRFVKAIKSLGVDVVSIAFRADEADLYTQGGTRITYVLGREEQAAGLAATAIPQLAINDGSIDYVDLRFSGKVYFKRHK